MNKNWTGTIAVGAVAAIMGAGTLFAHHSDASFDKERLTTIKGTVTQHLLVNPHQLLKVKVADTNGQVKLWVIQGGAVAGMEGWTRDTLKPGDQVTITGFANKDGSPGMNWIRIVKADGTEAPMTPFKRNQLSQFLNMHGKELSPEENELYKKMVAVPSQSGRTQDGGY